MSIDQSPGIHSAAVEVIRAMQGRRSYAHIAACVLGAVTPLIEAAVREQIAREIEARMERDDAQGSADFSEGLWSGLNEAKHMVARGEQR